MNGNLEKVRSKLNEKLNEKSDELDEWAETTGAKLESDAATIAQRVEAIKSETDEHVAAARKRVTAKRATAKAKFHEVATKAAEGADEGKAKFII